MAKRGITKGRFKDASGNPSKTDGEALDLPTFDELAVMPEEEKAKLKGRARKKANLVPAKKGEAKNPTGRNQYTVQRALTAYQGECALAALTDLNDLKGAARDAIYNILINGKKEENRMRCAELVYRFLIPPPTQKHSNADGSNLPSVNAVFFVPQAEIIAHNVEERPEIDAIPAQLVEEGHKSEQ